MGRIRQVKPEYWSSLAIGALSRDARLLFIGLWNYADDVGRGVDDPRLIKAAVFPLDDDVSAHEVSRILHELSCAGRIRRYRVAGRAYFEVVNWSEHQYVQRAQESRLPSADEADATPTDQQEPLVHEPSVSAHEVSRNDHEASAPRACALGQGLGSGVGVRGQGSGMAPPSSDGARRQRRPDPLWDALVDALGYDRGEITETQRGSMNRCLAQLRQVEATSEQIHERIGWWRTNWPDVSVTPSAIAKHWPTIGAEMTRSPAPIVPKSWAAIQRNAERERRREAASASAPPRPTPPLRALPGGPG